MARMIGTGAAEETAKKIIKRQMANEEAAKASDAAPKVEAEASLPKQKMKDASAGAYKDYQMQQAIEEVRKKKTAQRSAY